MSEQTVCLQFVYTNHRDETAVRRVFPLVFWTGKSKCYGNEEDELFLKAFDLDKMGVRDFMVKRIESRLKVVKGDAETLKPGGIPSPQAEPVKFVTSVDLPNTPGGMTLTVNSMTMYREPDGTLILPLKELENAKKDGSKT